MKFRLIWQEINIRLKLCCYVGDLPSNTIWLQLQHNIIRFEFDRIFLYETITFLWFVGWILYGKLLPAHHGSECSILLQIFLDNGIPSTYKNITLDKIWWYIQMFMMQYIDLQNDEKSVEKIKKYLKEIFSKLSLSSNYEDKSSNFI